MNLWQHLKYFNKYGVWGPIPRSVKRRIRKLDVRAIESLVVFCAACEAARGKEHRPCFSAERCDCPCYLSHILKVRNSDVQG